LADGSAKVDEFFYLFEKFAINLDADLLITSSDDLDFKMLILRSKHELWSGDHFHSP
jgi:hypothetical protein